MLANTWMVAQASKTSIRDSLDVLHKLVPNGWVLLAHIFAAIVVIAVITVFVWRPTRNLIQNRRIALDQKMLEVDTNLKLAQTYLKDSELQKLEAQKIANDIVFQSKKEADELAGITRAKNALEVKQIYDKALLDAENLKKQAAGDLKKNVTNLAFQIAEKIIGENADQQQNQKMVDEYLKTLHVK